MRKLTLIILIASLFAIACDKNKAADESATAETTTDATETSADKPAPKGAEGGEGAAAEGAEGAEGAAAPADAAETNPALLNPPEPEQAPDTFRVEFDTTAGKFTVKVDRSLAPAGADRFYNLVKLGYFKDIAVFRVIKGFMAQFGIHGDPAVNKVWRERTIQDDPVKASNTRGMITFAKQSQPNSRTTQLFINFGNNANLDSMGFAPFGEVEGEGMKVVDSIYNGYGEGAPRGRGPSQGLMQAQGNSYLQKDFPELDYIKSATIVKE